MVSRRAKHTPLAALAKHLIALNARSLSPMNSQAQSNGSPPLSRRQRRQQSKPNRQTATEESGGETASSNEPSIIPQKPLLRLTNLIRFLETYNEDALQLENSLASVMEKDREIDSLRTAIRELRLSSSEDIQTLKEENKKLLENQEDVEQKAKNVQEAELEFGKQKAEEKFRMEQFIKDQEQLYAQKLNTETLRLKNEFNGKVVKREQAMSANVEADKAKIRELEQSCRNATDQNDQDQKTLNLYIKETRRLESRVKELESKYPLPTTPLQNCVDRFVEIEKSVKAITQAYVGDLPPDDEMQNFETAQQTLCSLHAIFKIVPLSTSSVSKFLRVRSAQYIIMETLCNRLWCPFYSQNSAIAPGLSALLIQISERLAVHDRSKECLWRYLTYEGLDGAFDGSSSLQTPKQNPVQVEVERITPILELIIPRQKHAAFRKDFIKLLEDAINLWTELKKDSCMVEFDTDPPKNCTDGWLPEPCPEIEQQLGKDVARNRHNSAHLQPWCLFPKITLKPLNEKPLTIKGYGIFVDSPAIYAALEELRTQEELLGKMRRNLVRRPTLKREV